MNDAVVLEEAIQQSTTDLKRFIASNEQKTSALNDRLFLLEQRGPTATTTLTPARKASARKLSSTRISRTSGPAQAIRRA